MAAGGSHIGSGNGNRGKPYGLILLLAFGAALLGVMVLHKLRERRIFNLLVEEKDQELISLQLLLQKERERSKEMKRKTEEMKAKIYSLRTQKMELDRRLLEMRSTIGSMKDEQKIMESALEERQSEIKMLRETSKGAGKETLQMVALRESLKQKEAEIEDLKRRLDEYPAKIWSDQIEAGKSEEEVLLQEYENYGDGLNSSMGNVGQTTSMGDAATVENASGSKLAGVNNDQVYKSGSSREKGTSGAGEENNASNATGTNLSRNGRVSKIVDADNDEKSMDGEEHKVTGDGKPGLKNVQEAEGDQETFRGGVKLEVMDKSRNKRKEKHLHDRRVGGERGEIGGKNRLLELRNHENNGAEKMRSSKFPTDGKAEETRKAVDSSDGKTMEHQNDEDSKDLRNKPGKDGTDHRMSEVHKTLKRHRIAHDRKELTNGSLDGQPGENRSNDMKQRPDKDQESRNRSNMNSTNNSDEQVKIIKKHEKQEQTEDSDPEQETDAGAGYFYKDPVSDFEEEYREETDESEF
ncbi:hypothetical protein OIU78_026823 [Salix suchowensis]|nr:hypothetical protein OIU78_026823 [Salix suchowensis]